MKDISALTGEGIKIVVVDSGVYTTHPTLKNEHIHGIGISYDETAESISISDDFADRSGHGTATYSIIRKNALLSHIIPVRLFSDDLMADEKALYLTLEYIYENIECDIINLSLGITVCENLDHLEEICRKFNNKGTILISAFDNAGAISYPAALDTVIGIDSGYQCTKVDDFEYVENSMVNIRAKGGNQRVAWLNPEYLIIQGNSFAAAYVTAYTAKIIQSGVIGLKNILAEFKSKAKRIYHSSGNSDILNTNVFFKPKNVLIFPYNKEMHSLLRFKDILDFNIHKVCDVRVSGRVGISLNKSLQMPLSDNDLKVENLESLDWNAEFDTVILGHTDELSGLLGYNICGRILEKCLEHHKNIISFDSLKESSEITMQMHTKGLKFYYPKITKNDVPKNCFGKMYRISKPVVGIFGTSSQQGKFTLQMQLREKFIEAGYKIGQMGTEPSALLYGVDEVYPVGYNSTVEISGNAAIYTLNSIINNISKKNPDIIIVGSQSGTVPYDFGNLVNITQYQIEFLLGTHPDAVLLCVNPYDDIDYIKRTIGCIESLVQTNVVGIAVFPMTIRDGWTGGMGSKIPLSDTQKTEIKNNLSQHFEIPVYILGNPDDITLMFEGICNYFSEESAAE